jgi:hypothetical protein
MVSQTWYWFTAALGTRYQVFIHWEVRHRKVYILGLDLWRPIGHYKGFWDRDQMPTKYIKWAKLEIEKDEWATYCKLRDDPYYGRARQ